MQTPDMFYEARLSGRGRRWPLEILIFIAVFIVATSIQSMPVSFVRGLWFGTHPETLEPLMEAAQRMDMTAVMSAATDLTQSLPDWFSIVSLFSTALMTAAAILFCRWLQKRSAATLGLRKSGAVREYLMGAGAAVVLMSAAVGIGLLTGAYRVSAGGGSALTIALYLIGYLIQGMSEEVLCRGYLMVSVARKNPVWLSVVLSALLFAALHLANPGLTVLAFINLVLFGVLMSVYVLKRGDLWGVCGLHSFWNFFQGHVYGIRVSGITASASLLTTEPVGSALWSGGDFGAEGSLGVTLLLAASICLVLFVMPRKADEFTAAEAPVPAA